MALSTLLEIVIQTCDELGLARPGTVGVVASSVPQDRQMLALLNSAGNDLVSLHPWSGLIATASVSTTNGVSNYSLPSDFVRLIPDAGWDRTNRFPMQGSISPQRYQSWLSSTIVVPATRKEYRLNVSQAGSTFDLQPTPTATETLSFLYLKNSWVISGASSLTAFAADTDTTIFKPQLLVKELKWRFRSAKGLLATDLLAERNILYDMLVAADISSGNIDMGGSGDEPSWGNVNVTDGNWTNLT